MGSRVDVKVFAGVSAAFGIISRRGVSTTRHLDTNDRWIQDVGGQFEMYVERGSFVSVEFLWRSIFNSVGRSCSGDG